MKKKWKYKSKEGILSKYRNYNDDLDTHIINDGNFQHVLFRYLNIYSASLKFYSKKTKYYNKNITLNLSKEIGNQKNLIMNKFTKNNEILRTLELFFSTNNNFYYNKSLKKKIELSNNLINQINKLKTLLKINSFSVPVEVNDYNKIVVCSSIRRLQDKAQVYSLEENDYPRTRLTHSIEVASTAETMVYYLKSFSLKMYQSQFYFRVDKALESGCIIHDVGNPPFGHYGEKVIRKFFINNWDKLSVTITKKNKKSKIMKLSRIIKKNNERYLDFAYFDGNAQSLRIMSKLQEYKLKSHLEISFSILGAIIKYPYSSTDAKKHNKRKFGYFFSEKDVIEKMKAINTYVEKYRNPLSMLVEAADDITYITSDLDDAAKKETITYEIFNKEILNYKVKNINLLKDFNRDFMKNYKKNITKYNNAFYYTLKYMLIKIKQKAIEETTLNFNRNFSLIFDKGIYCFNKQYSELLNFPNANYGKLLLFLKDKLINKYVFRNCNVVIKELKGERILNFLLSEFTNAVLSLHIVDDDSLDDILNRNKELEKECKLFSLISSNYIDVFIKEYSLAKTTQDKTYYKLRLVVDYISGMTDSYSNELYTKLTQ